MDTALQDLRYSLRGLRRSPGFTVTALITLALATGAVSTVISLANAMLWRPVAPNTPSDLTVVAAVRRSPSFLRERVSYVDYLHIRDHTTTLRVAAQVTGFAPLWVTDAGATRELFGAAVSASYFSVLGLKPALGRFFTEDEDHVPDRDRVVVLSHRLWREQWGASAAVLGAVLKIYGVPFTVIGVAPEGFEGLVPQRTDVYLPTMMLRVLVTACDPINDPNCETLHMFGRPRDNRTLDDVKAEIPTLVPSRWKTNATTDRPPPELTAVALRGAWGAHGQLGLGDWENGLSLSLVAGVCLLLGCVNLGGLLLARGSRHVRDLAVRASLGATPFRLLRQLLTDSVLLAVGGGALGLCLSIGLARLFLALFHEPGGFRYDASPDVLVVASAAAVSVGAGFLLGLVPALKSIRLGAAVTLFRQASSAVVRPRLTRWLIGTQVAVALALVVLAGLLEASSERFVSEAHFEPSRVALFRLTPGFGASGRRYSPEQAEGFHREVLRQLEAVPGVLSVSLFSGSGGGVLTGSQATISTSENLASSPRSIRAGWKAIAPGYFSVLGTPLLRGRDFDARDSRNASPVAIVNQSLAASLWPTGDPIGSSLMVNKGTAAEVVGVVADISAPVAGAPRTPEVYLPFWQGRDVNARYCARVAGSPAAALSMLTSVVNRIDPDVPVREAMPMTVRLGQRELRDVRRTEAVTTYGAVLAVLLSAIGIYGTLAFSVVNRTKELGVRIAVGASPWDVIDLIVREEMKVVLGGVFVGLGLAWGAARLSRHLLYGAASGNEVMYAAAALGITAVGLLACSIPACRAARLDPTTALKAE